MDARVDDTRRPATEGGDVASVEGLTRVDALLTELGSVVVAFSGGTDSAFLAHRAAQVLGGRALAVTAVSPSLASGEVEHCRALAEAWGLAWEAVRTAELDNPAYVANAGDRCYWCKAELMDVLAPVAARRAATVVLGVNVDDLGDHRPGQAAAAERGARFPLVEAGLSKDAVRALSRRLGLPTWDRPAAACLSSRLPYGTAVTVEALARVDRAEAGLRALGFRQLRVRHYDDTARVEVDLDELGRVVDLRAHVVAAVHDAGYRYVTLDLEGFRSGNLNAALSTEAPGGSAVSGAVPVRLGRRRAS